MRETLSLSLRNLKRYYRNKGAFFFSFLSVFIVVGIYVFFLADMQINNLEDRLGSVQDLNIFIYTWIVGGLLCIPAICVPLIVLTFIVEDVEAGIQEDLFVAPVKRSGIMLGYILSSWITGVGMSVLTLVLGEAFIVLKGGPILSVSDFLLLIGIISLIVLVFSGFSFFMVIWMKSNSSVIVYYSILNTLIGFLAGLYVPIGYLSRGIAAFIKVLPLAHASSMLRQIMMRGIMQQVFNGVPASAVEEIKMNLGVNLTVGGHVIGSFAMVLSLATFGMVFYIASMVALKSYKRK